MRELYACAVTFMDHNVGKILRALYEEGLAENTLVLFVSDHGEMLGDLDTYQKFLAYDPSCRIPMLLRWPGRIPAGSRRRDFTDLNDILPTILDAAGVEYPGAYPLPGESLLTDHPVKNRSVQYVEHQRGSKRWCCCINERYKYVHFYGDADQLFDLKADPEERIDLLHGTPSAEICAVREEMYGILVEYERRWGLPGYIKDGDFVSYPPYQIQRYQESCFPSMMIREPGAPPLTDLAEEILQAIKHEPTVHLDKLHIEGLLTQVGGMSKEEFQQLLTRAAAQGN